MPAVTDVACRPLRPPTQLVAHSAQQRELGSVLLLTPLRKPRLQNQRPHNASLSAAYTFPPPYLSSGALVFDHRAGSRNGTGVKHQAASTTSTPLPSKLLTQPRSMGEVDAVLRELHSGGFTALASDVVGLRPQKVWRPAFLRLGRPSLCSNCLLEAFYEPVCCTSRRQLAT